MKYNHTTVCSTNSYTFAPYVTMGGNTAEHLLDAGSMMNRCRLRMCSCPSCVEFSKAPKSEFAMVASRFHDARIVRSGLVLRALLEDWSFAQITDALK
jgi:hypothetical protein